MPTAVSLSKLPNDIIELLRKIGCCSEQTRTIVNNPTNYSCIITNLNQCKGGLTITFVTRF